ncbi:alanine racemase [Pseudomonas gessardii]|uniref:Amino acid decarboxylase n=1 Tax=Pseudomonas gessardii TaxID=78544 RepID=A0ABS9FDD2_9PSED|nr:alanine racemase [Pseudomonas gessardii]MCF4979229.1 amino acid decarboxylase [Pseudomonas gessardii]MCF4992837.1 amino acid decarboxylase [Pseudomonas gessardii]MCF5087180.1 amino acid decarboxylase [Pseudomonas gessardii]MCF5095502.1 amino acid decarboxylase [Pseudomonas gessardii]MCF5109387.1 amino acid decarboxylase [Pseudomonas gessardii]
MTYSSSLPGLRHLWVERLLERHTGTLTELVDGLGSPLHLVCPQVFHANVEAFQHSFAQAQVRGSLLFAKKANKANCFIQACAQCAIGVDVASVGELQKALAGGVAGCDIGVSGPRKSDQLLGLGLSHQCLLAVDSLEELLRIQQLALSLRQRARLLLRYCPSSQAHSRFGLNPRECEQALVFCRQHVANLDLQGFSFHLGGYDTAQRAHVASQLIDLCQASGLDNCRTVNLGGGFAVRYVDPAQWQAFLAEDCTERYHNDKGFAGFYPYGALRAGAEALDDILATAVSPGLSLGQKVIEHGVRLLIEPGRALLDQAGISVFRVQGVKDRTACDGYALVTVQGSSFNLSEQWFNSEFLPDPLLLPASPRPLAPFVACIGGASCLESDMLTWRKVAFDRPIQTGDLLIYLNTAGYQMDSNESPFHEAPLPHKVVVELRSHALRWKLDSLA